MKFHNIGVVPVLALVWIAMALSPASAQTQTPTDDDKQVAKLLDGSGYKYVTHRPNVWSIEFSGKEIGKSRVVVSDGKGLIVIFVTVAKKAAMQKSPDMMEILLRANHTLDQVKIGFDDDGDLSVRLDAPLRTTDLRQIKDDIVQVMNASNEVFGEIGRFLRH